MEIQTFVILNLQTTGYSKPRMITELCFIAVSRSTLLGAGYDGSQIPRVGNRLTLCFNPGKDIEPHAEDISGTFKMVKKLLHG